MINDFLKEMVIREIENSLIEFINDINKMSHRPLISKDYPQITEILNKRANEVYDFMLGFCVSKMG